MYQDFASCRRVRNPFSIKAGCGTFMMISREIGSRPNMA